MDPAFGTEVDASDPIGPAHAGNVVHISQLLPECLAHIFSLLSVANRQVAAQVCVAWRDAAYQPCVWRAVQVRLDSSNLPPTPPPCPASTLLPSLAKRGIRRLKANHEPHLLDAVTTITNLTSLTVTCNPGSLGENVLPRVFAHPLSQLGQLNFECECQVDDALIANLVSSCPNLTALRLKSARRITDKALLQLATSLRQLQVLQLNKCQLVSDEGIAHLALARAPIRHLGVSRAKRITDQALWHMSVGLRQLNSLDLSHCRRITNRGMHFLRTLKIGRLNISGCTHVDDTGLRQLTQSTDLVKLQLTGCYHISDTGMTHLAQMPNLTELDLSANITNAGLSHLANGKTRISTLDLQRCGQVTNSGLEQLSKMAALCQLSMCYTVELSATGLRHLADGLSRIAKLDLSYCLWLSDNCFVSLARMSHLRELRVVRCCNVTGIGLAHLVDGGSALRELWLTSCWCVTDEGVRPLTRLTGLRVVHLSLGTITQLGVDWLRVAGVRVVCDREDV